MTTENDNQFKRFKIIASESKSWYVGQPGTTKDSFSVTWSPGALLIYGASGNITLIFSKFNSYENARNWLSQCSLDDFKGTVAHELPDNIDFFYKVGQFWASEPHYT